MEAPRVNPVGLVERPPGFRTSSRPFPRSVRLTAAALLVAFAVVTIGTTVASLGSYCLTTDASDARALPWGR